MDLSKWCASASAALADPEDVRARPQATRLDRKRIKELERARLRKDRALAETAALLRPAFRKRRPPIVTSRCRRQLATASGLSRLQKMAGWTLRGGRTRPGQVDAR